MHDPISGLLRAIDAVRPGRGGSPNVEYRERVSRMLLAHGMQRVSQALGRGIAPSEAAELAFAAVSSLSPTLSHGLREPLVDHAAALKSAMERNAKARAGAGQTGPDTAKQTQRGATGKPQRSSATPKEFSDRIAGKDAVSYKTAAELLGIGDRQLHNLISEDKLIRVGPGKRKKITVSSLQSRYQTNTE